EGQAVQEDDDDQLAARDAAERVVHRPDDEGHDDEDADLPVRAVDAGDRPAALPLPGAGREHVALARTRPGVRHRDVSRADAMTVLRMTGITKRFPGTLALDGVHLAVERGEIHGLLGENGAGKSTLLKILAGDYQATAGEIELDGERVEIATPRRA